MRRKLDLLSDKRFDLLVVGGGIHGATLARAAAISGLKTALIEQSDFCHATSANSLKILHGGIRYLQALDFLRIRASKKSQSEFQKVAPHLVLPIGCMIPTYGSGVRSRPLMRCALAANDLIGALLGGGFGKGRLISKDEFTKRVSIKIDDKCSGGALWYDAMVTDTERMTLVMLHKAYGSGACIANYVKALKLIIEDNRVEGVEAVDNKTGREFRIKAKNIVNSSGPWVYDTFKVLPEINDRKVHLARGLNLIVDKRVCKDLAVGIEKVDQKYKNGMVGRNKRFFFFVPWRGKTMIGTAYKNYYGDIEDFSVQREDIEDFITEINEISPNFQLRFEDVVFFHAGLLPVSQINDNNPYNVNLLQHTEVIGQKQNGAIKGLFSIRSVKYTTAPFVADMIVKQILAAGNMKENKKHHKKSAKKPDSNTRYATPDYRSLNDALTPSPMDYLASKYGEYAKTILKYIADDRKLGLWISKKPPLMAAEVIFAIRGEMAYHLRDVVFRRTGFGTAGCPSSSSLSIVADIMGQELGWDSDQKADEVAEVFRCYAPLAVQQ
jgi:glycerol-3-phosphate dehydrogenase